MLKEDSIEELVEKSTRTLINKGRMNSQKLAETIQRFNEMGSARKNEDLGRNPNSLKALKCYVFMPFLFVQGYQKNNRRSEDQWRASSS